MTMTPEGWIALVAIGVTILLAIYASTARLSAQLAKVETIAMMTKEALDTHIGADDRRFEEVFTQQRELAKEHFWLAANVETPQARQGPPNMPG